MILRGKLSDILVLALMGDWGCPCLHAQPEQIGGLDGSGGATRISPQEVLYKREDGELNITYGAKYLDSFRARNLKGHRKPPGEVTHYAPICRSRKYTDKRFGSGKSPLSDKTTRLKKIAP